MPPLKDSFIILKTAPLRETSLILYAYTEKHGLLHTVCRGIKRDKKQYSIERGAVCEGLLYIKDNRDLHTAASLDITSYFPFIRKSIVKTALRDTAFELAISSLEQAHPNQQLYTLFIKFLENLNTDKDPENSTALLWLFSYRFLEINGQSFPLDRCIRCGRKFSTDSRVNLSTEQGGLVCCACSKPGYAPLKPAVLSFLSSGKPSIEDLDRFMEKRDFLSTLSAILDLCRFQMDIRRELKSMEFLKTVF
ncbi:MAG: DNA repair protein RecO [Chitinivibrionales bacterium]